MRRNTFSPRLETLDGRVVPAGLVTAELSGGDLFITGDSLGNEVRVAQAANGTVTVTGQNGTLINGLTSVTFANAVLNKIEANMEAGNDVLTIARATVAGDILVQMDDGNDRVVATNVSAGLDAIFIGGAGIDVLDDNGITGGTKKEVLEFESVI